MQIVSFNSDVEHEFSDVLRPTEKAKIDCGKEHFKAMGEDIGFTVANKFSVFIGEIIEQ